LFCQQGLVYQTKQLAGLPAIKQGEMTRMNLKEKIARAKHPLLFLALLIPAIAGQVAVSGFQR
jgi:hypothetical protein